MVTGTTVSVPAGSTASAFVWCPDETVALGGGYAGPHGPATDFLIGENRAVQSGDKWQWRVTVRNNGASSIGVTAFAQCASVTG